MATCNQKFAWHLMELVIFLLQIQDSEKNLHLLTHVPEGSTIIDIIQTVEDCLPLNTDNSQTPET